MNITVSAGRNKSLYQNSSTVTVIMLVIGILLLVGGVVAGVLLYQSTQEFMKTAEKATATISDIQVHDDSHTVTVTFTTASGAEQSAMLGSYNSSMKVGKKVDIYYEPANPSDIKTGTGAALFVGAILGIIGAAFIFAGIAVMAGKNKDKRLRAEGARSGTGVRIGRACRSETGPLTARTRALPTPLYAAMPTAATCTNAGAAASTMPRAHTYRTGK